MRLARYNSLFAALSLLAADHGPLLIQPRPPEPHPADSLPEPFRSNEKIRAAEAKRARRAAKRRGAS